MPFLQLRCILRSGFLLLLVFNPLGPSFWKVWLVSCADYFFVVGFSSDVYLYVCQHKFVFFRLDLM